MKSIPLEKLGLQEEKKLLLGKILVESKNWGVSNTLVYGFGLARKIDEVFVSKDVKKDGKLAEIDQQKLKNLLKTGKSLFKNSMP